MTEQGLGSTRGPPLPCHKNVAQGSSRYARALVFSSSPEGTKTGAMWECLGCYPIALHVTDGGAEVQDSCFQEDGGMA